MLKKRDKCPIHDSYFCCGREPKPRFERRSRVRKVSTATKRGWYKVGSGLWRIDDENHPRGYREKRNKTAMTELLRRKIAENNECGICRMPFIDFRDVTPDHISPRGMGGAYRDDHPDNIQPAHWSCNREKGSRRMADVG